MKHIKKLPKDASFEQQGLKGYNYNLLLLIMSPAYRAEDGIAEEDNDLY